MFVNENTINNEYLRYIILNDLNFIKNNLIKVNTMQSFTSRISFLILLTKFLFKHFEIFNRR